MSNDFDSRAALIWGETHDVDAVLQYLRGQGYSKFDSIKALRELLGLSLGDAKRIVSLSPVWRDSLEESRRLHDSLISLLQAEAEVESEE